MEQKDMLEYLEHRQNKINYPPYAEETPRKVSRKKIMSFLVGMGIFITFCTTLHQIKRDLYDMAERITNIEIQVKYIENKNEN